MFFFAIRFILCIFPHIMYGENLNANIHVDAYVISCMLQCIFNPLIHLHNPATLTSNSSAQLTGIRELTA